ncbi:MAG TPA: hypothetical protein VNS63_14705 [Blastocatellia bacterium]|nr:hypothetical protein [Blastocatellia bacterium]
MPYKGLNRSSILTSLEIAFAGVLVWMILSGLILRQDNTVQASQKAVKATKPQKQGKVKERWIPQEGVPVSAPNIVAGQGTTVSCQVFDFAGGATQGFTTVAVFGTPLVLWHPVNAVCRAFLTGHSTPYDFYFGQDLTCNYNTGARTASNLISPSISLAGKFPPFSIAFNYLLYVEGGGFDTTFVDISTDNGATWTQVLSKANLINDNQWHNVATNVTAFVGAATSVRLRFRFDSIDNTANSTTGWHVDDIQVCGEAFDQCVQDDVKGDYVQFNSITGAYVTKQCSTGFTSGGVGTVTTVGSTITLQHFTTGIFNRATVNTATHVGSASIRVVNGLSVVSYNIKDSNTLNNTCICP